MKKSIITIVAFMLFALASFAQGGERVYIKIATSSNASGKWTLYIYEGSGEVKEQKIESMFTQIPQGLKGFGDILESYFKKGYKLVSSSDGIYILQKD